MKIKCLQAIEKQRLMVYNKYNGKIFSCLTLTWDVLTSCEASENLHVPDRYVRKWAHRNNEEVFQG